MAGAVHNVGKRLTAMTKFLGKCLGYIVVASTQTNLGYLSESITMFGEICVLRRSQCFFNKTVNFAK